MAMDKCKCINISATLHTGKKILANINNGAKGDDYRKLDYLPTINGEKVIDDKNSKDYHLQDEMEEISNLELEKILGE